MGGAVTQDINVKIQALVAGLNNVKELSSAMTHLQSHGGKTFNLDADKPAAGAFNLVTVLRQLSPALNSNVSRAEQLTGTLGTDGLLGVLGPAAVGVTAIGAALTALGTIAVAAIQKGAELGSKYHDLSAASDLTVETLSGLDSQLRQSGTSTDTLARGTLKMQQALGEAERSGKSFGLGITDNNAALGDIDGTLRTVLTRLGAMTRARATSRACACSARRGKSYPSSLRTRAAT